VTFVAIAMNRTILPLLVFLALAAPAAARQTVFLVRHAERADTAGGGKPTEDPDLSEAGRARAASLATVLKDANIAAIFTTQFKRTQQTAAALAKALGISPTVVKSGDADALSTAIAAAKGNILVVGHSNSVPAVIERLGVTSPIEIADEEYDNLFIVTRGSSGPTLVRLRYR
jgi:phosphohistidine phosphatase SixA